MVFAQKPNYWGLLLAPPSYPCPMLTHLIVTLTPSNLSPKEIQRVKRSRQKKKFKSASFVDSDDVADMMDSKPLAVTDGNVLVPSSETTASQDERLMFYYPFTGKYQEHVLVRDVKRLDGPIFLNDIIMNFYIKYVSLLLLCTASTQRLISLLFTGAFVTLSHHLLSTMSTSLILFF